MTQKEKAASGKAAPFRQNRYGGHSRSRPQKLARKFPPVTFERNGSMAALQIGRNDTPQAQAISDAITSQFATVNRALGIIGWPIRLPGTGGES